MTTRQVDILKQSIPTLLLTLALLIVAQDLRVAEVVYPAELLSGVLSPLGVWMDAGLEGWGGMALSHLALLVGAIVVTRIVSRYSLSVIRSFVPMVLYFIVAYGVLFPTHSPALMFSSLMMIISTEQMIMSFRRAESYGEVMKGAFWIGLAAAIVPDFVYVALLLPLHWILWQRSLREVVAAVIMLLLPIVPTSFGWWVAGEEVGWFAEQWWAGVTLPALVDFEALYYGLGGLLPTILLGTIVLLSLVSIVVAFGDLRSMRTRARKGHIYFVVLYLMGVAMLLMDVPAAVATSTMGFASVPLLHTLFVRRKGGVMAVIYVVVLALSLACSILPIVSF